MTSSNPILESKRSISAYSLLWVLFGIIHFGLLLQYTDLPLNTIIVDSIVHLTIFAILGIGIWHTVQFNTLNNRDFFNLIVNHIAASAIVIIIWIIVSFGVMSLFSLSPDFGELYFSKGLVWRLGMGVVYYSTITMVYYMLLYSKKLQERNIEQIRLEALVKETELNMLKWQLNPHFLFNSLNSISSLALSEPEKAHEMIILLSDFLRYSLTFKKNEETLLKNELQNIESYLEIEKIRFGEKLQTTFQIEKVALSAKIPNLLLQPLYENAIKYGVQDSDDTVRVTTTAKIIDSDLHVSVSNPFDKVAQSAKGNGVGLVNISERLQIMYGVKAVMNKSISNNIFTVKIIIPQKNI